MKIRVQQGKAGTNSAVGRKFAGMLCWFLCAMLLSSASSAVAQIQEQPETEAQETGQNSTEAPVDLDVSLPDSQQMALALSTPGLREQAFLDLAAAANLLNRTQEQPDASHAERAQSFSDDRAWLQLLIDHTGWVQPRSSILDPGAWLVLDELQQYGLEEMTMIFPGKAARDVLVYQVFQRSGQRYAAASLPVLLLELESNVIPVWDAFLQLTGPQDKPDSAWKSAEPGWLTEPGIQDQKALAALGKNQKTAMKNISKTMSGLALNVIDANPIDDQTITGLRYAIFNSVPTPDSPKNPTNPGLARDTLYLVSVVEGLENGRYFDFVEGLLSITTSLLEQPADTKNAYSLADWLVQELPAISARFAPDFAKVDARLNIAVAAAYDVLLSITKTPADDAVFDARAARLALGNAAAQLALMIPDMGYYFETPVRGRVVEEIHSCMGVAASIDDNDGPAMTREQFDTCMETLLQLADGEIRQAELAGNMSGPFTTDTLRRELSVAPWQRINYGIGYLHKRYSPACSPPDEPLPNPLEWAVLATTMTWFAEHSPEFFNTPENESRLTKMRSIGERLTRGLAEQAECLAGTGASVNDAVVRSMTDYELALRELEVGLERAEADFRTERLRPGADVSLDQNAMQPTTYRPDDLIIKPCDAQAVCEMSGDLSTTRALIGLFPEEILLAEQTGLGQIEICYRNMEWVERRSELVRADDENVANYHGHLGFDPIGRYTESGTVNDIFAFRFTSPDEYHYLFAQTSEEVLNDSCPTEWVGSRIVTPLRESRGGIVPNRLTYLAASRKQPSRLLQGNWDRGAEWRDWFVTGIGVTPLEVPPAPEMTTRLNQHLQSLYQAEQAEIYQRVLLPNARNSQGDDVSLFDEMSQVSISKAMIRMQIMLFYSESLLNSDDIRKAIAGDDGLLEGRTLRRFREDNTALISVGGIARERLDKLRKAWLKQPETVRRQGSAPNSLAPAMTRINFLYRQFFRPRPEPLSEIEVVAGRQD
jgi:hypothetical protein